MTLGRVPHYDASLYKYRRRQRSGLIAQCRVYQVHGFIGLQAIELMRADIISGQAYAAIV